MTGVLIEKGVLAIKTDTHTWRTLRKPQQNDMDWTLGNGCNVFLVVLKPEKSRQRSRRVGYQVRASFLVHDDCLLTGCPHGGKELGALWCLFYKDTNSVYEGSTLITYVITSQGPHLRIPPRWELGFNMRSLGTHKHSIYIAPWEDWRFTATSWLSARSSPLQEGQLGHSLPSQSEEHGPAGILIADFWPTDCEAVSFCSSKSPSLWLFVLAALVNNLRAFKCVDLITWTASYKIPFESDKEKIYIYPFWRRKDI